MSHSAEQCLSKKNFLPYAIKERNKLDPEIRNSETYASFRKMLLNFIRPKWNSAYKIYHPLGIKLLLTRLRFGSSHLSEHKFRQNFADTLNPLCFCSLETESTLQFFLRCQNYTVLSRAFMTDLKNINDAIVSLNESDLLHVILYGNKNFDNNIQNEYKYTNCDYQIYQTLKCLISLFFNCY